MSAGKYPCIFSRQMETIVYIIIILNCETIVQLKTFKGVKYSIIRISVKRPNSSQPHLYPHRFPRECFNY